MPLIAGIFGLVILLIYSYLGERFSANLLGLSGVIYQSEWYRYSKRVRRYLVLMMVRSQQPFYLNAYGLMTLNLANYIGVSKRIDEFQSWIWLFGIEFQLLKWIYSAFMVLHNVRK